jgi:hypothetical protein
VVSERIPLENDLVIVRTKGRTYVFPCVTGNLTLDQPMPEIRPDVDTSRLIVAIPDWELGLSGIAPGYVHVPNTPDPTIQKEG